MIGTIVSLILAVILGGLFVIVLHKNNQSLIKIMLAFSGGFLLSIAFNHFVPALYEHSTSQIGLFILAGFLIQLILEFFSGGIEHGHIHHHPGSRVPIAMLISLCIHSFIEGVPLGSGNIVQHAGHDHGSDNSLLLGILFHQFPVAIALMTLLVNSSLTKVKAWIYLLVFALMTPSGMLLGWWQQDADFDFSIIMAIVVGMFLHISTTIIFEISENHKFNLMKLSAIIGGAALALLIH
jgi:zinc transporter ZupT